jgi:hypothetical protein
MDAVYLAHDSRLNRQVVLKVFGGGDARGDFARQELLNRGARRRVAMAGKVVTRVLESRRVPRAHS